MSASNMNVRKRKVTTNDDYDYTIFNDSDSSSDMEVQPPTKKSTKSAPAPSGAVPSVPVKSVATPSDKSVATPSDKSAVAATRTMISAQQDLFIQLPLTEDDMKRHVYITSALARVMYKFVDCRYSYASLFPLIKKEILKCAVRSSIFESFGSSENSELGVIYECKDIIQFLLDHSPKAECFRSRLMDPPSTFGASSGFKRISHENLMKLIRTHFYDPRISGIQNGYTSIYSLPMRMTSELCDFLGVPHNTKMPRATAYDKIMEYIQSKKLLKSDDIIECDDKLHTIFLTSRIQKMNISFHLRNQFIYENTHCVQIIKTNEDGSKFVEESFYRNSENKKHGPYVRYYPNGKVKYYSFFFHDFEDGLRRTWYETGSLRSFTQYNLGKMNIKSILFDQNGNIMINMDIENGVVQKWAIDY